MQLIEVWVSESLWWLLAYLTLGLSRCYLLLSFEVPGATT